MAVKMSMDMASMHLLFFLPQLFLTFILNLFLIVFILIFLGEIVIPVTLLHGYKVCFWVVLGAKGGVALEERPAVKNFNR